MPTVTFRLSVSELTQLQRDALARGVSVSFLVREALSFRAAGVEERLDDLDRRVGRVGRPRGWIRSAECRAALEARSVAFVGMSARYFKRKRSRPSRAGRPVELLR